MPEIPRNLQRLAQLYGVQTSYLDMRKKKRSAHIESVIATVRLMGAELTTLDRTDSAIARRQSELDERIAEPVVVAWNGKVPSIKIKTGPSSRRIRATLKLEDGSTQDLDIRRGGSTIPKSLPTGYHRLELQIGNRTHETLIISTPLKAHVPFKRKEWGLFAPVYSLHSKHNPNAGNLREFELLMDWMRRQGGRITATLPLLSAFLDAPFEPSPYAPASRLFWNEFYIDAAYRPRRYKTDRVDYRREMRTRRRVLENQASEFFKYRTQEHSAFRDFVEKDRELGAYARFRAVTEAQCAGWTNWPQRLRDGHIQRRDYNENSERYHLFAQWRIQSQLGALATKADSNGQLLYLDLPLGLHPDGYDIWRYRDLFVRGASGGAPPDPVFTHGQNWGFPPMHPEASRTEHYKYTIAYIRNHLQHARLLRIDHVMGLHRLFWIPDGLSAAQGLYVKYPADELYAILCLESHRNRAGIVGENLGTVPPEVNTSMRRHNILQMCVVQYELEGMDTERALRKIPANSIASLNTHDMPPFRGFLSGSDIEDRLDLGLLDRNGAIKERKRRAAMKKSLIKFLQQAKLLPKKRNVTPMAVFRSTMQLLASSMARIVLVNIEDLWGESLPQNVPATNAERPNWRRRNRLSLEQFVKSTKVSETLHLVEKGRR